MSGKLLLSTIALSAVFAQDWSAYHGGFDNTKYSSLRQINTGNVARLKLAWKYDTGDKFDGSEMQCNPLIVHGTMYATTPKLRLVAIDAATGKLKWTFDPDKDKPQTGMRRNRLSIARKE